MSLYDTIDVRGNNLGIHCAEEQTKYQTRELHFGLYSFILNSDNQLIHDRSREDVTKEGLLLPTEPLRFNGELWICGHFLENGAICIMEYTVKFVDFKAVSAVRTKNVTMSTKAPLPIKAIEL